MNKNIIGPCGPAGQCVAIIHIQSCLTAADTTCRLNPDDFQLSVSYPGKVENILEHWIAFLGKWLYKKKILYRWRLC